MKQDGEIDAENTEAVPRIRTCNTGTCQPFAIQCLLHRIFPISLSSDTMIVHHRTSDRTTSEELINLRTSESHYVSQIVKHFELA